MNLEEAKRLKAHYEKMAIAGYIIGGVGFILYLPVGASGGIGAALLMMGFFAGGFLLAGTAHARFKKISSSFKEKYMPSLIEKVLPGTQYYPESGFAWEDVASMRFLKKSDRYHSEDYLIGTYKNIRFESADCKLQDVHSNGKTTTVVTVFLGRVYRYEFPKNFPTELLLIQPGLGKKWGFGSYETIKTESIDFNKEFLTFARDELKAFEMLLPQFMEKLLELDRKYNDKIAVSFVGNTLNVAINNNIDTLEIRLFHPLDETVFNEFESEIGDVKSLLDSLYGDKL
ncbi:MAG TPA: DUF3137 domain-containing protein [Candidatus Izemoplasmatales bacterium]|nr:DUF3137 domain-containing protein [Candidatus Izemoplasmatales bacterium]